MCLSPSSLLHFFPLYPSLPLYPPSSLGLNRKFRLQARDCVPFYLPPSSLPPPLPSLSLPLCLISASSLPHLCPSLPHLCSSLPHLSLISVPLSLISVPLSLIPPFLVLPSLPYPTLSFLLPPSCPPSPLPPLTRPLSTSHPKSLIICLLVFNMVSRFLPVDHYSLYVSAIIIQVTELGMPLWFCCSLWNFKQ